MYVIVIARVCDIPHPMPHPVSARGPTEESEIEIHPSWHDDATCAHGSSLAAMQHSAGSDQSGEMRQVRSTQTLLHPSGNDGPTHDGDPSAAAQGIKRFLTRAASP